MRISFISYWSCPLTPLGVLTAGGMNVYLLNLASQLEKLNAHIDIFTTAHNEKHESTVYLSDKISVIHVEIDAENDYQGSVIFAEKIIRYISDKDIVYDIIHAHYYYSGLSAIILKKTLKIPFIQTFHTLGEMKKKFLGVIDNQRINSEKEIVEKTDALIASTILEKKDLIEKYNSNPGKVHIVNPGVDHNIFKPLDKKLSRLKLNLSDKFKYILFVGRIDPVKGLNILLEAVNRLNKKSEEFSKKFKLLIIGGDVKSRDFWKNRNVDKIVKYIKSEKLELAVEFLGNKPHNELPLYYSSSDIVILPSVYESFGLVILEAMACGCTVAASRVGGLKYLVKNDFNGMLFRNGNVTDLVKIIEVLLKDEEKRKYLGQNALKTSQNFSWGQQGSKMLSLYKKYIN